MKYRTLSVPCDCEHAYHPQASQAELKALTQAFDDRDASISNGLLLQGRRYEVRSTRGMHARVCTH